MDWTKILNKLESNLLKISFFWPALKNSHMLLLLLQQVFGCLHIVPVIYEHFCVWIICTGAGHQQYKDNNCKP